MTAGSAANKYAAWKADLMMPSWMSSMLMMCLKFWSIVPVMLLASPHRNIKSVSITSAEVLLLLSFDVVIVFLLQSANIKDFHVCKK